MYILILLLLIILTVACYLVRVGTYYKMGNELGVENNWLNLIPIINIFWNYKTMQIIMKPSYKVRYWLSFALTMICLIFSHQSEMMELFAGIFAIWFAVEYIYPLYVSFLKKPVLWLVLGMIITPLMFFIDIYIITRKGMLRKVVGEF